MRVVRKDYAAEIPSWKGDASLFAVQQRILADVASHQPKMLKQKTKPAIKEAFASPEVAAVKPLPTPSKQKKTAETPARVGPSPKGWWQQTEEE